MAIGHNICTCIRTKAVAIHIITVIGIVTPVMCVADDLRVVGKSGTTNELKQVYIDYSSPSIGLYTVVTDRHGLRISQGDATISVEWARLHSVTVASGTNATCILKSGITNTVNLAKFSDAVLYGDTDLGTAEIRLRDIKTIEVLPKPIVKKETIGR